MYTYNSPGGVDVYVQLAVFTHAAGDQPVLSFRQVDVVALHARQPARANALPRPAVDSHTPGVDSNTPGVDSNTPGVDSHTLGVESHTPAVDLNTPGVFLRAPWVDSHTLGVDSNTPG
eukprot:3532803-Pyramimonas_sp.AAC.1